MILANISGVLHSVLFITENLFNIIFPIQFEFWKNIISMLTTPTIIGLLIRFQRVQVQLSAQEENIIKILCTIKRAKTMEVVFVFTLVVAKICMALEDFDSESFKFSPKFAEAW